MSERQIAALYVETDGCYFGIEGVDPWDLERDARTYSGPYPVVAHPPCKRWGAYWSGGPSAPVRRLMGDDGHCFAAALWSVRTFGGVLEHPEGSNAWDWCGISKPLASGGWSRADGYGWTCCVEQGHYGHRARKSTWPYLVGASPPSLKWGKCKTATTTIENMGKPERLATPEPFRDLLIGMARSVQI